MVDLSTWQTPLSPKFETDKSSWRAISTANYNASEQAAMRHLSIPSLMAFQPASFQSVGWPTHVRDDEELARYADHNFEAEVPAMYHQDAEFAPVGFVNAFTPLEAELAANLRETVADFTARRFGRAVKPMTNLMVQFGPYRCMEALSKSYERKLDVFEPGPGAGFLGALLAQNGYTYASYDVTQSLYLWQSHLLDAATGGGFSELAHSDGLSNVDRTAVLHMPWWMFALQLGTTPLRYDLVYSNSNLGEMTAVAFRQLILYSKLLLQDSEVGAFTFFSSGMTRYQTLETIDAGLRAEGFVPVMTEPFHCYQLQGRDPKPILDAFENGIPHIGGTKADATLDANEVFRTPISEAPVDMELTKWFHGWKAPTSEG